MSDVDRWRSEMQSAWIYHRLASSESDPRRAPMFAALAVAAEEQAGILLGDIQKAHSSVPAFSPSLRARAVTALARTIGVRHTRPMLAALKVRGLAAYLGPIPAGHPMPHSTAEIGARHRRAASGGTLRAAIFGVNDGLVSNTSLIMGMAGATADTQSSFVLVAGIGGLLAGAFSMAAGEYVSMRSQRELYEHQIGEERSELERYPEEEAEELALIYAARGVPVDEARALTHRMLSNKEEMLNTLAREELGLNPHDLGSPGGAAISSFLAFATGATVPLVPFLVWTPARALVIAALLACAALFAVGSAMSLFSGKSAWIGGVRMLAIGAAAGALTFALGNLVGSATSL